MRPHVAIKLLNAAYPHAKHLLREDWLKANHGNDPATGFCYIAAEALYHMIGGTKTGYSSVCASTTEGTHWWLAKGRSILDPTKSQYGTDTPPYAVGRKIGFLNGYSKPSKRATELIEIAMTKVGRPKRRRHCVNA